MFCFVCFYGVVARFIFLWIAMEFCMAVGGYQTSSNSHCTVINTCCTFCQVLEYLSMVNFTTPEGERVYFDSNGDSPARYELVNLQITNRGTMEQVTVGIYDASQPGSQQFIMSDTPLVWGTGHSEVKRVVAETHLCTQYELWKLWVLVAGARVSVQ